ncbi:hypothetical protein LSTR_LSTR014720 [Laodelphax striatellus]|uniref:Uncharacterized protein n=1 Tax=Laodelphax striatellus TaxID=195883 RepID=A0A482WQH4_LAOST|nr:hypothetical protein LSTR_LSTR012072 [Laodelphax striatellus]RZF37268.1 hypothetical protein LSTR_LSTR014720 [Laodelphax striatellus]
MRRFTTVLKYFRRGINTSRRVESDECHHRTGGVIGINLPFDIHNETRFTVLTTIFLITGLGLMPFVVHRQLKKQNSVSDDK